MKTNDADESNTVREGMSLRRMNILPQAAAIAIAALAFGCGYDVPPQWIRPEKAVDWAVEHGLTSGNVYSDYNLGGYLISRHIPTFIDGRALVFGPLARKYFLARGKALDDMLDEYHVTWTLLHPWGTKHFDASPHWKRAYEDDVAVIHVRQ